MIATCCSSVPLNVIILIQYLKCPVKKGILTISDTEGFAQKGVLINLYKSGKNIKFEINKKELIDSGFTVSPYLLSLAKIVNFIGGGL